MKSNEIEFQGFSGTGSCLRSLYGQWRTGFAQEQVVHDLQ